MELYQIWWYVVPEKFTKIQQILRNLWYCSNVTVKWQWSKLTSKQIWCPFEVRSLNYPQFIPLEEKSVYMIFKMMMKKLNLDISESSGQLTLLEGMLNSPSVQLNTVTSHHCLAFFFGLKTACLFVFSVLVLQMIVGKRHFGRSHSLTSKL